MSDVIITLGRGVESDGSLPPDALSRVRKAVELFNNGVAPLIIMSGAYSYHSHQPPLKLEAAAMKEYAQSLGVPNSKIIEEVESKDTLSNVFFTKKIAEHMNLHSLTIVASDEYMPRIKYLVKKSMVQNIHSLSSLATESSTTKNIFRSSLMKMHLLVKLRNGLIR